MSERLAALPEEHREPDLRLAEAVIFEFDLGGLWVCWLVDHGPVEAPPGRLPAPKK